ncbi:MAG: twin-arginine translocation signal domain-containing protein [Phycisphaera sp.]|nr:twin-arginine translocation signal domain-containing protein [Phycisphaera sp.]
MSNAPVSRRDLLNVSAAAAVTLVTGSSLLAKGKAADPNVKEIEFDVPESGWIRAAVKSNPTAETSGIRVTIWVDEKHSTGVARRAITTFGPIEKPYAGFTKPVKVRGAGKFYLGVGGGNVEYKVQAQYRTLNGANYADKGTLEGKF